jgi:hypothetical protein
MSMKPGATTRPLASISRVAGASIRPTSTTRPSCTPTSAWTGSAPVPSWTRPPRMAMSRAMASERAGAGAG